MKLLVAGGDRVDAGKTTFTTGLLERTDAVGFKPRAGNDFWFHHDDYDHATSEGRLFGKDARRLVAAGPGDRRPEAINPIHRLWRPAPGGGAGILGREDKEFLVDRVGDRYVVNDTVELPPSTSDRLPLAEADRVSSLEEFNAAMEQYHVPALASLSESIAATDRAVVESYGDVARPLQSFEPDAVAVVEPKRARVFDGERYVKACGMATGSPQSGQLEERVPSVVDLVDPVASVELPALGSDERSDPGAVADAYAPAYEALLAAAFE